MILLLALIILLSGCFSAQEERLGPVTIEYWHAYPEHEPFLNQMVEEFNQEYPDIQINIQYRGYSYEQIRRMILLGLGKGDFPTLAVLEPTFLASFAESGLLEDLNPYLEEDKIDKSDFYEPALTGYAYKDMQAGLPLLLSANVYFYNKDLLEQLNQAPPQTWQQLEELGQALQQAKTAGDISTRHAFGVSGDKWMFEPWMINGGTEIVTDDGKTGLTGDGLNFIHKLKQWQDDKIMYFDESTEALQVLFSYQNLLLTPGSSSNISRMKEENADRFEVGTMLMPGDKQAVSQIGGLGMVMLSPASEQKKKAAWKFMQHVTSAQRNIRWAEQTGYLPFRKSALETEEGTAYLKENPEIADIMEQMDRVVPRLQHPYYGELSKLYDSALSKVLLEDEEAETVYTETADKMNQVLAQYADLPLEPAGEAQSGMRTEDIFDQNQYNDQLTIRYLDMKSERFSGDAILIRTPDGMTALIDAGLPEVGAQVVEYLKKLGIDKLDAAFNTHTHEDHIGGFPTLLRDIQVERFYMAQMETPWWDYFSDTMKLIEEKNIELIYPEEGDRLMLGDEVSIEVLNPPQGSLPEALTGTFDMVNDINDHSLVLRMTYGNRTFLFTGDIYKRQERLLVEQYGDKLKSDYLHAGHHGFMDSSAPSFLAAVDPEISVMSNSNFTNLPLKVRYEHLGIDTYTIGFHGNILVASDGETIEVITEKDFPFLTQ